MVKWVGHLFFGGERGLDVVKTAGHSKDIKSIKLNPERTQNSARLEAIEGSTAADLELQGVAPRTGRQCLSGRGACTMLGWAFPKSGDSHW